ncbi:MAG: hypothetical protein D6702_00225 [Planctomycetota bacterium]|nr:MAG: hypothetical protein D6702_00225 [Planctomycetota bacterium]
MSETRPDRRIEPVPDDLDPEEVFDPRREARPVAALWLLVGPLLSILGLAGWLRLVAGVPRPAPAEPSGAALGLDAGLLLLFVLPHSLLARGSGRRLLNRPFGPAGERPLYVLVAGATLTILVACWQTSGPLLWSLEGLPLALARTVQALGLLLSSWATLVVGAAGLLGLPHLRALEAGTQPPAPEFVALPPYRWLRQPINLGFLLLLAGMPEVTTDRLLLGLGFATWILLSAPFEERDNEPTFGQVFLQYRRRTPRWLPRFRRPPEE